MLSEFLATEEYGQVRKNEKTKQTYFTTIKMIFFTGIQIKKYQIVKRKSHLSLKKY